MSRLPALIQEFLVSRGEVFLALFKPARDEVDSLNGLRAVSILAIFLLHIYIPAGGFLALDRTLPVLDLLIRNLTSGLDLFFVLSGYLVYGRLIAKYQSGTDQHSVFGSYLRGRFLRIVPAYYFALLGSLWFLINLRAGVHLPEGAAVLQRIDASLSAAWTDLLFVSNYSPDRLLDPGWSLGVEVQYYLLLPILVPVVVRLSRPARLILLGALYLIPLGFRLYYATYDSGAMQYYYTHTRIDSIFAGMIASEVGKAESSNFDRPRSWWVGLGLAVPVVLLLGAGHLAPVEGVFYRTFRYSFFNAGFAMVLLMALPAGSVLSRILSNLPLRYVARISYSMYLWHPILATVAVRNNPFHTPVAGFFWNLLVGLLLTILGATLAYLFIEQPFHRMGRSR